MVLESCYFSCRVLVNSKEVGQTRGGYLPNSFDARSPAVPGRARRVATVERAGRAEAGLYALAILPCCASSRPQADMTSMCSVGNAPFSSGNAIVNSEGGVLADEGGILSSGEFEWLSFELDGGSGERSVDLVVSGEGNFWRLNALAASPNVSRLLACPRPLPRVRRKPSLRFVVGHKARGEEGESHLSIREDLTIRVPWRSRAPRVRRWRRWTIGGASLCPDQNVRKLRRSLP